MEPLLFPEDEQSLLPQELYPAQYGLDSTADLQTGRGERSTEGLAEGEATPTGGGDSGDGGGRGGEEQIEIGRERQRRGIVPYDSHSVHVVTQYYIPDDPSRAREVRRPYIYAVELDCVVPCHALRECKLYT